MSVLVWVLEPKLNAKLLARAAEEAEEVAEAAEEVVQTAERTKAAHGHCSR